MRESISVVVNYDYSAVQHIVYFNSSFHTLFFTARCYAERASAVMLQYVICQPVCLSVCYVEVWFYTGWNSSKIISRPNSLRPLLGRSGATGIPPKLLWSRGGVNQEHKNLQYLQNGARQDQGYYYGLIGSHTRAFDWYQNQRPWMTLNGVSRDCPMFF